MADRHRGFVRLVRGVRRRLGRTKRAIATRLRDAPGRSGRSARPPSGSSAWSDRLLGRYRTWLPEGPDRTVVVLASARAESEVLTLLRSFPSDRVHVISADADPGWRLDACGARHHAAEGLSQVNSVLRYMEPVDVMLDLVGGPAAECERRWAKLFLHLKPAGVYVIHRGLVVSSETDRGELPQLARVAALVGVDLRAASEVAPAERELADAASVITFATDVVVAIKRTKHYLKIRDAEAADILPARSRQLRTRQLRSLPPRTFASRATVTSYDSSVPVAALDAEFSVPALNVREYRGKIAMVSSCLLYSEFSVLPESFRHPSSKSLRNGRLVDAGGDLVRIPRRFTPRRELSGAYYHLDSSNSGHFGHLMTEVVSRLWGWDVAKANVPDLKAIFRIRFPNERDPALERRVFTAYGIPEEDIVWVDEPVWLQTVFGATPMWHNQNPHWVHPEITTVWDRLGRGLADRTVEPQRLVFVSRPIERNRACRNTGEVESMFADRGFAIVHPERLDLSEQAGIFANAEVIAGFGGSALFNMVFAKNVSTLIVLSHEAYTARNEHLFASVLGCDSHYFWSAPDVAHPPDGWSEAAYYSDWEFDLDRNRAPLEKLLDSVL